MPASDTHTEWARGLAEKLVESGDGPPTGLDDEQQLALAWALKDVAYTAWSTNPVKVSHSAMLLWRLSDSNEPTGRNTEIHSLACWTAGIANLVQGRMGEAVEHLDRASNLLTNLKLANLAAQTGIPKIMALAIMGEHELAIDTAQRTLEVLSALRDFHAAAKVALNLGNLYGQCNEHFAALRQFESARRLFDDVGDVQNSVACEIGAADAYSALGDFARALDLYGCAKKRADEAELLAVSCVVVESVALVKLARGQYGDALRHFEDCRITYRRLDMPQNAATAEKQLADTYLELRLLPEALALFDAAIARFDALEMPVEQAWALTQRGRTLAALGQPFEAVADCLLLAWDLFSKQGVTSGLATVQLARAELALTLDRSDRDANSAEWLGREAAEAFGTSGLAAGKAQANVVRAYSLLQCADVDTAAALFASTLETARTLQLLSIGVRCQVGLGLVAKARGDVRAAESAFESAIAASEEQRSALPGDDLRGAFLVDQLRPYEELLRIALNAFDCDGSTEAAASVLTQLERFRARALGERLGEVKSRYATGTTERADNAQDIEQTVTTKLESELRAQLSWLYRRKQKLIDDGDDAQPVTDDSRRVERELLEAARRRRLTTVPAQQIAVNGLAGEIAHFDAVALQSALGEGEALVEYGVIDDELFACVVTSECISLHRRVAGWPDVLQAIRTARFQIETCRNGAGAMDHHLPLLTKRAQRAMQRVHDLIWAPMSARLTGHSQVLVVPHEQLGSLPFAALYDGEAYLAQHMSVAMVGSARVAHFGLTHLPVPVRRAVVLGESSRLVHAEAEAQFVASLFHEARVLTGPSADAVSLRSFGADAEVLHLACHAEFRSDNPMFSALHLADGPFTVHDAETLRLPQGVVVLSACETGVSEYSRGDEMIGLVRAFLVAGTSRVVASLWPVDDAVTREFMAAFYPSLRAGNSPAVALRTAQVAVMQTHPHPFHWAAFTLYGGW